MMVVLLVMICVKLCCVVGWVYILWFIVGMMSSVYLWMWWVSVVRLMRLFVLFCVSVVMVLVFVGVISIILVLWLRLMWVMLLLGCVFYWLV